jgi:hypothetical protein
MRLLVEVGAGLLVAAGRGSQVILSSRTENTFISIADCNLPTKRLQNSRGELLLTKILK